MSRTLKSGTKSSKYVFLLKNINTDKIDLKYGITLMSNMNDTDIKQPDNTTNISDLVLNKSTPEVISFLDESKREHKCNVSMIDFETRKDIRTLNYNCFWCRHSIPIDIVAIGCPLKYIASQTVKNYYSEISKDNYSIKENITSKKKISILAVNDDRLSIIENDYYLTDCSFCSFNCAMAFIHDNKSNSKYNLSEMLLLKMYSDMYNEKNIVIDKAPSYKLLKEYGGHLSINNFRSSFNKIDYVDHGVITNIPRCKSVGILFEQMLKF